MIEFGTKVRGIPCLIRFSVCGEHEPPSEFCPGDEPQIDRVEVCDCRGRPADWIEEKMTTHDEEMLHRQCWEHFETARLLAMEP